jgi:hypothetical protein
MAPPRPLLALLALAAVAAAVAQNAGDGADVMQIPPSQTLPLSAAPGCGAETLEPSMDTCMLQDTIKRGDVHEYTFTVPPRTTEKPFSVLLTAKSVGGLTEM